MTSLSKIFVTGADGFIGSHLVEALVRRGESVKALNYYNSFGTRGWLDTLDVPVLESMEIVSGDIRDSHFIDQCVQGCDTVMHLASLIAIPYSYHATESYIDTNIKGTLNVLNASRNHGVDKIVHTSTSEVYGTAQFVPITEDHLLMGQSPYSATKIGADQLALSFYRSFELPVATIRPFNTYGPRQSLRAVIPTVILQLLNGTTNLKLGALHPTRDFSFVEDTVRGFISVAESPDSVGEVINVGSGFEISIMDTAKAIGELLGVEFEIETDNQRLRPDASEVERLFADIQKADRLLGWTPVFGGLDGFREGLTKTIDWYRNPENLRHYNNFSYTL